MLEFQLSGELLEGWRIPTGYLSKEKRGHYFSGMLEGLITYWAPFMKGVAVVFERDKIQVVNTPLKISFDNTQRPSKLILEKWCSSAPIIDDAVAKILLSR